MDAKFTAQISPADRWLTNQETIHALKVPFKSALILNNKKDPRYCPDFPRHVHGKWLASAVFKYIDSKLMISQPLAAISPQKDRRGIDRRVAQAIAAKIERA